MTGSNPPSPAKVELFDRLMAVKWLPEYTDAELAEHGTTRDEMMAASNAKAVRLVWVRTGSGGIAGRRPATAPTTR